MNVDFHYRIQVQYYSKLPCLFIPVEQLPVLVMVLNLQDLWQSRNIYQVSRFPGFYCLCLCLVWSAPGAGLPLPGVAWSIRGEFRPASTVVPREYYITTV